MSQTFFSKLDAYEKNNRLSQLGTSRGAVIIWEKGKKDKHNLLAIAFDKNQQNLVLDSKVDIYPRGTKVLCSFELRGMSFFAQAVFQKSIGDDVVLEIQQELFKSEKRSSYRLMTFPMHDVWSEFDLGEIYEGGKVVDLKSRSNQTALFKNFLNMMNNEQDLQNKGIVKVRVQDISTTGLAIHIGELESKYFAKDRLFKNVNINFIDQSFVIPEIKVVYVVSYISGDKNIRKFKVGLHFSKSTTELDNLLGKKINQVLRESDQTKDFEKHIK
jgi:hypothetical protein